MVGLGRIRQLSDVAETSKSDGMRPLKRKTQTETKGLAEPGDDLYVLFGLMASAAIGVPVTPDAALRLVRCRRWRGSSVDDFCQEVESTRNEIACLEAEAVALAAVAETGSEFGDAVDNARKKAELLYEAQAAGKKLAPEMRAEIDELPQA